MYGVIVRRHQRHRGATPTKPRRGTSGFRQTRQSLDGRAYSFVVSLARLNLDHAFLERWSTVPAPYRDTSNTWSLISFFHYISHPLSDSRLVPATPLDGYHLVIVPPYALSYFLDHAIPPSSRLLFRHCLPWGSSTCYWQLLTGGEGVLSARLGGRFSVNENRRHLQNIPHGNHVLLLSQVMVKIYSSSLLRIIVLRFSYSTIALCTRRTRILFSNICTL